jgi:hypothetical protein
MKPPEPESDEPTLVLTGHELLEPEAPPVVTERAPLRPRVPQVAHRDGSIGTGSVLTASGDRSGRPDDVADMWRMRLLAVSGLLVVVVILVVLLLAK